MSSTDQGERVQVVGPVLSSAARRVMEHLDYLEETWDDLVAIGVEPGGRKQLPSSRRRRSEESIAAAKAEEWAVRLERAQPGWVPPLGRTRAPLNVDMLDLLSDVVSTAEDLALTITQTAGVERPRWATSAYQDPRPYLQAARAWLTAADEVDGRTVPWAAKLLGALVRRVAAVVGEIVDGQVLEAFCPWCEGRSEKHPTGGERTLVVRAPKEASTTAGPRGAMPGARGEYEGDGPLIVCYGTGCAPPPSAVGTWLHGQPAWPEREWDWLAKQLEWFRQKLAQRGEVDTPSSVAS